VADRGALRGRRSAPRLRGGLASPRKPHPTALQHSTESLPRRIIGDRGSFGRAPPTPAGPLRRRGASTVVVSRPLDLPTPGPRGQLQLSSPLAAWTLTHRGRADDTGGAPAARASAPLEPSPLAAGDRGGVRRGVGVRVICLHDPAATPRGRERGPNPLRPPERGLRPVCCHHGDQGRTCAGDRHDGRSQGRRGGAQRTHERGQPHRHNLRPRRAHLHPDSPGEHSPRHPVLPRRRRPREPGRRSPRARMAAAAAETRGSPLSPT